MKFILRLFFPVIICLMSCQNQSNLELKKALTFHLSFDNGTVPDFALGDKSIYTASSRRDLEGALPGMNNTDHRISTGGGRWGDAFQFGKRSDTVIFYKSKHNIAYDPNSWSGTISFWLSLDPATDLEPGYTDPIQITDVRYNDAAIWVDFTNENPRNFRLGVIGDKIKWEPDTVNTSASEEFERRLVTVKNPPFKKNKWTHIVITFEQLGTAQSLAILYLDGNKIGSVEGINDPFTWELEKSNIYLGLNFTGLMDELSIFNRPLTPEEILTLYQLEGGVKSML